MKKTTIFVLCSLLVFGCLMIGSEWLFHSASFPLVTQSGDVSLLQGVRFGVQFHTFDVQFHTGDDMVQVDVTDGKSNYAIKQFDLSSESEANIHKKLNYQFYQDSVFASYVEPTGYGEWHSDQIPKWLNDEIIVSIRSVDHITYQYQLQREGYMPITVNTELTDYSNASYGIYEVRYDNILDDTSIQFVPLDLDGPLQYGKSEVNRDQYMVDMGNDTYYLMPATNAYITGTNYIYRLTFGKEESTCEKVVALPKDRYALELYKAGDALLALYRRDDGQLYFEKYDTDGTLLGSYESEELFYQGAYLWFCNDSYMLQYDQQQTITVFDTDTMRIVAHITIDLSIGSLEDAIYQNDTLYCLYNQQEDKQGKIVLTAYQQNQLVYQGSVQERSTKKSADIDVWFTSFERS